MAAFKANEHYADSDYHSCNFCHGRDFINEMKEDAFSTRLWSQASHEIELPMPLDLATTERNIGEFPLTSGLSPWATKAMATLRPEIGLLDSVKPFSEKLHNAMDAERRISSGLHDLNLVELTYQYVFTCFSSSVATAIFKTVIKRRSE
jgi:hypothetical protein